MKTTLLEVLREGLEHDNFKIRFDCAKEILRLSGLEDAIKETRKPPVYPETRESRFLSSEEFDEILKELN